MDCQLTDDRLSQRFAIAFASEASWGPGSSARRNGIILKRSQPDL
jgi:hypothetical protein